MKAVLLQVVTFKITVPSEDILKVLELVICADSGVSHAFSMNIIPDIVVGDMDSISKRDLALIDSKESESKLFLRKRILLILNCFGDSPDGRSHKYRNTCSPGGRPDHSLANILQMIYFKRLGVDVRLAERTGRCFYWTKIWKFQGQKVTCFL